MKLLYRGLAPGGDATFVFTALRKIPLLAPLSDLQLYEVVRSIRAVEFAAGETVFRRGDPGDAFFVVQSGRAEARVPAFLFFRRVIGTMRPGDVFGELALILDRPRAADVVCAERTACFVFDKADLADLDRRHPEVVAAIRRTAAARS